MAFTREHAVPPAQPDQYQWVVVATKPGPYFGLTTKTFDAHRLTTSSAKDMKEEFENRKGHKQRLGTLGANQSEWYATFTVGPPSRVDEHGHVDQVMEICSSYEELRSIWIQHSGKRTVTQLASLGDELIAVFEPMHIGERCNLFWHNGKLSAQTLHEPKNRQDMGLVSATYFKPEDKWVMVFSDSAPVEEKWSVGPNLDRNFIQRGYDNDFCVRLIMCSDSQWLILMQKTEELKDVKQSILYSKSKPTDFEMNMWKDHYIMTNSAGNMA